MNKLTAIGLSFLFLFLFGCQTATMTELPTEAPVADVETATPTPLAAMPAPTDYCLECHTDQERLTTLAKPEESHESESKGVG